MLDVHRGMESGQCHALPHHHAPAHHPPAHHHPPLTRNGILTNGAPTERMVGNLAVGHKAFQLKTAVEYSHPPLRQPVLATVGVRRNARLQMKENQRGSRRIPERLGPMRRHVLCVSSTCVPWHLPCVSSTCVPWHLPCVSSTCDPWHLCSVIQEQFVLLVDHGSIYLDSEVRFGA